MVPRLLLGSLLLACSCDRLIGIHSPTLASLDAAAPDAPIPDAPIPDAAILDAAIPDAAVADAAQPDAAPPPDLAWALWPMPDSSRFCTDGASATTCPTSLGQDGDFVVHPPTYTASTDTVTDEVTGLVWQRNVDGVARTFDQANTYCTGAGLVLPTRIQLLSIVDYGRSAPAIDPTFPSTVAQNYWSASVYVGLANHHWVVSFNAGNANNGGAATTAQVRCVGATPGGGSSVPGHYTVSTTDDTVLDDETGLLWQRSAPALTYDWKSALSYCQTLFLAGGGGWRLPSVKELATLVDETAYGPAVDTNAFPTAVPDRTWSGTPLVSDPTQGWTVDFTDGYVATFPTTNAYEVRCVR